MNPAPLPMHHPAHDLVDYRIRPPVDNAAASGVNLSNAPLLRCGDMASIGCMSITNLVSTRSIAPAGSPPRLPG